MSASDPPLATAVPRIVVTGSECTGKTTLSQLLAKELHAHWVPEYARAFAESVHRPLTAADVPAIALGQIEIEEAALASSPSLMVQDTDLLSTVVYARHYYGACPEWIVSSARGRLASMYLLSDIDIPWVDDGVRDRPLERRALDALFRVTLAYFSAKVGLVSGLGESRLLRALDVIRDWRVVG